MWPIENRVNGAKLSSVSAIDTNQTAQGSKLHVHLYVITGCSLQVFGHQSLLHIATKICIANHEWWSPEKKSIEFTSATCAMILKLHIYIHHI